MDKDRPWPLAGRAEVGVRLGIGALCKPPVYELALECALVTLSDRLGL